MSTLKNYFLHFFLAAAVIATFGCTKKESKEVNLAIWGSYLSPELVEKFTKETGIKINVSNYTSNEELLAKVQAGSSGIDVAVPSDYMVQIMIKLDLLEPIDMAKITNKDLFAQEWMNQSFDPGNNFSLPYAWSTAGIAVNRALYKGEIKDWKDFLENPELKGKFSLLDDVREVTAMALKFNGATVNSVDPKELEKAKALLLKVKPNVKMFRSDTVEALVHKEIAVAHAYSSDALMAGSKDSNIEYILPASGGTKAMDNLVVLKNAKNKENAFKLLDFMSSKESNLNFVVRSRGGPVLKTTRDLLPADIKNNPSLFPDSKTLSKFESLHDLGENTKLYDTIWTSVKSE